MVTGKTFPTRLQNDLDRLIESEGGPIALPGMDLDAFGFGVACDRFPYDEIEPLLRPYQTDERKCRVHWPWVAVAAKLYRFEQEERAAFEELKPSEVIGLFHRVSANARKLAQDIERLRYHSNQLEDPKKPEARGHLAYLHEFFKQRALADFDGEFTDDPLICLATDGMQNRFVSRLARVGEIAEEFAAQHVDQSLLTRSRGQDDPGLPTLVWRLGEIWKSLTGRNPSANKVHRQEDERSDFVRFVGSVAALAGSAEPTTAEIAKSLP